MTTLLSRRAAGSFRSASGLALAFAALSFSLGGCAKPPELFKEPSLSPVGSGFVAVTDPAMGQMHMPARRPGGSLFQDGAANLFTDPRAAKVGDVISVHIMINDKATFGNTTGRSQTAQEAEARTGLSASTARPTPSRPPPT